MQFVGGNDHFFLNLAMPGVQARPSTPRATSRARRWSSPWPATAPTSASRCPAPAIAWFTGPAQVPDGLYLGAYGPDDANPDIGDSAITETAGLGGFAMAAAPAIVRFVGGTVADALATTRRMYEITLAEHPAYSIPVLDFRGTPCGIDVDQRGAYRHPAPDQHRAWPARWPAPARSVPVSSRRPAEIFPAALRVLASEARSR